MNPTKISKFLSLVLRHRPDTIGVELDSNGWVDVDILLAALTASGASITREELIQIVHDNDKQRFVIMDNRIRANQGHSVDIDLGLEPVQPPGKLFHGTASRFLDSIKAEGLQKMNRQHVHLSVDEETATSVGIRYGKPVILEVAARSMYREGFKFYLSENGVWLVDAVPWKYLVEKS